MSYVTDLGIDPDLWSRTRAGARAGRGFRYQDAVAAWLATKAWADDAPWRVLIPEGLDDLTLHGEAYECRAQIKSRHDPQTTFSVQEVATHLAKSAETLPDGWWLTSGLSIALILERPVQNLDATGWTQSLADAGQAIDTLRAALAAALGDAARPHVQAVLARAHLIVEPEPLDRGVGNVSASDLEPAAARLVLHKLRELAGDAADANFKAAATSPHTLTLSDVQARRDAVQSLVDPEGYLRLTGGLCDLADFDTPLSAEAFWDGVNILPGHVGAGLVFARPDVTDDVFAGLEMGSAVLIAGPSGAGKSGVAWLAAYDTRHTTRWFRVRDLQSTDVARLIQLGRRLEASARRPVGFVVDDVGRPETAGWDRLVAELKGEPGLMAIGTVREEDIFVLSTATSTPIVRPQLDAGLAERIWSGLHAAGLARFAHWQEPYELSRGLLLEYTHLLTEGRRLQDTLTEQVRRRLAEDRGDELLVLRPIALAAALGCAVEPGRLRTQLGFDEPRFAKALQRLIDEHAIRSRGDGALTGLHEIRSTYLDEAIADLFGDPRRTALSVAAECLSSDSFAAFILRALRRWPDELDALLQSLEVRLAQGSIEVWSAIFHGLGLASLDRVAARWLEIAREAEIDDRHAGTMLMLAIAESDLGEEGPFAKLKPAQVKFAQGEDQDLRARLCARLPEGSAPPPIERLEDLNDLAAALLPLPGCPSEAPFAVTINGDLSEAPLENLVSLLRTFSELGPNQAQAAVDAAGGSDAVLQRIYEETPWATRPELGEQDGDITVTGDIRVAHPEVQADVHAEVVRLCEMMAAAAPQAQWLIARSIFPGGRTAGYNGFAIADKRMPRQGVTAPARVAWNRALLRALHRLVAAPNDTGRITALAGAIGELGEKLLEAGDFYCRRKQPNARWRAFLSIRNLLTHMVQPMAADDAVVSPRETGGGLEHDELHGFVTDLQRLLGELTDPASADATLMAARTAHLAKTAGDLQNPYWWRLTRASPLDALAEIEAALWEVRAVLGDVAGNPNRRAEIAARYGGTSQRHRTLPRAAADARRRAEASTTTRLRDIEKAFAAHGLTVKVCSRPKAEDGGWLWPSVEYAVLVNVPDLFTYLTSEAAVAEAAGSVVGSPQLDIAPVIGGQVAPLGTSFINGSLLPNMAFADEWGTDLPFPVVADPDATLFDQALDTLGTLAVVCEERARPFNRVESEFAECLVARFNGNIEALDVRLRSAPDEILTEACGFLAETCRRLLDELADPDAPGSLANELVSILYGEQSALSQTVLVLRIRMLERAALGRLTLDLHEFQVDTA